MVRLRQQKAQVEEYNASQRIAGLQALGEGFGGLLGGLGKGLGQGNTREGMLANRLRNQAEPPRAMAVNPALQAAADTTVRPGQASYADVPMTAGGPFTGGVKGLNIQTILDKTAMGQERLQQQGDLNIARMGHMATLDELRRVDQERKDGELNLKQEAEARRQEQAIFKNAQEALKNATPAYKEHLSQATTYTQRMKANLAAAAGAKTPEDYDKAVSLIDSEYMTGQKLGYKLAYPEIPIPGFQRQAGQALQDEITRKQAQYDASWTPQTA